MIPLRDQIPTRQTPWVNYTLIAINVLVFLLQINQGENIDRFVQTYALIPSQLTTSIDLGNVTDIFTSMFMHAGLAHIGGNMLYLYIFGDNVEDALGHIPYLIFYLFGGILAALTHVIVGPTSPIPTVGASGAIAAVLGAYLFLYPRSHVTTLLTLGFFIRLTTIPATLLLGFWFVLQFFQGVASLGLGEMMGGTAWWAHIGGFAAGYVLARIFIPRPQPVGHPRW